MSIFFFLNGEKYMTLIRPLGFLDLHNLNRVNLDKFTENFSFQYYAHYIATWPELCLAIEAPDKSIVGYLFAKVEGYAAEWHGHVSAISIAPEYRGKGAADALLDHLEDTSRRYGCHFVDLFVRVENAPAISLYKRRGYTIYQTLHGYYSEGGAAYDMRFQL
eukprot:Protomagalhaensia_sp_Gyna_25__3492@NODE_313_length_3927_cov_9_116255_g244_i0_p4_GENE_NODE_313_length_3927_cov_9_116255_g244_i0NODE_313_length_3927_cov_9_116255_g244_i0_p4_ORF_typecomplete_len162_score9_84Acetyltransf_1/PF00583_25/1_2e17Acetyltransf_10/PF13673_7/1_2e13Acetyltransf_4/PF13420_7/2e13Acetyltransf_7/PF13508_7/3_6e10FR47/PF08445_10/7_8e09Acetyltransf_9/PF13527_7/1_1e07Acetyltransf_3/PF13302_7/2_6e05GNAT_acetyltran/PF12746_7/5_7e05Gly_acyl_tr_C/PF08444_10/0_11Acetyltransf_13/PF13880_6/0